MIDANMLRDMVREAARTAFTAVRRKQPDERFYVFALQSLDDATGVYAHANTEEGYQRSLAAARTYLRPGMEKDLRWSCGSWDHQNIEFPLFREIYTLLNSTEGDPAVRWVAGRAAVYAAMVGALADLDAEGMFGRGAERELVTLFCTLNDSYCREWLEMESASRLNSPQVYRAFAPVEEEPDSDTRPVYDLFVGHLKSWI